MKENAWTTYSEKDLEMLETLMNGYKAFLTTSKTERECAANIVDMASRSGYVSLEQVIKTGTVLRPGDKVYATLMGKMVILAHMGEQPLTEGVNIIGSHMDSPRLDVKQNPLYEESGLAYLDTHYYGGIKKYQWTTVPMALHGVIIKKDGTCVPVNIGEGADDPVFCISDLLVHLANAQTSKKAVDFIEGEKLDVLIGSRPLAGEKKNAVKANILKLLKEKYDVEEDDFISAEIEVVPAGAARDFGLDRSMILSYGQDDKVCVYTSLMALLAQEKISRTSIALFVDKEETGSLGATGMQSRFFENTMAELLNACGQYSELALRRTLSSSFMLSADVCAAYDPLYGDAFEKKNIAYFGQGVAFNKYTGARGKSGTNDANAEYVAKLRRIMDDNNVAFQTAELGKVDAGGGGTIAYILALYGMNVMDCGVPVMSMHAPWEICSKSDIYETEKAYEAFYKDC